MSKTMIGKYLIQSKMPGIQGENGCWIDQGIVTAESPKEAIATLAQSRLDDNEALPETMHRVGFAPNWEEFFPLVRTQHVKTIEIKEA